MALPGSRSSAKARLVFIKSWPGYSKVASGNGSSCDTKLSYISSTLPPFLQLPAHALNSVSPENNTGTSCCAEAGASKHRCTGAWPRSEEHTSELQSRENLVC